MDLRPTYVDSRLDVLVVILGFARRKDLGQETVMDRRQVRKLGAMLAATGLAGALLSIGPATAEPIPGPPAPIDPMAMPEPPAEPFALPPGPIQVPLGDPS